MKKLVKVLAVILAVLLIFLESLIILERHAEKALMEHPPTTAPTESTTVPTEPTEPEPTEPEPTEPEPRPVLVAKAVESTKPSNWGIKWSIIKNDEVVKSYTREDPISFEDDYFALPGIAGFRGGNYRNDGSYGTANITTGTITPIRDQWLGSIQSPWSGAGWSGQAPVVQWDAETRQIMNLYDSKKEKDGLVEAVYAKMDGYIHFIDMEDGSYTRDPLFLDQIFKGSGTLDPRGYPILYIGSGIARNGSQRIYAISLIDGEILFKLSGSHKLAPRSWCAFDAGPLIDAETDTLIWPGENGLLYTIKLNTKYDKEAGTISMKPGKPVIGRATHNYSKKGRYPGFEASATAVQGYVYLADNSGMLMCIDINTMKLIWAQDLMDDVNATPVFEWEGDKGYLYVSPSLDYTTKPVPIYKLDAETGEIVWKYEVKCAPHEQLSGGSMSTPLLGRPGTEMEDMIVFTMTGVPKAWFGTMYALNKKTGEVIWEYETGNYSWSSPIALYTDDGKAYIFQACASSGKCLLLNSQTGELLDSYTIDNTVEASPVAFNNHVLLGTRNGMNLFEIS